MAIPDITGNPYTDKGVRDELRKLAQPLTGACGGAESLARDFGPTDVIELLDLVDFYEALVEAMR